MVVLAICFTFAATVEFLQVYAPARTCCGSDVLAQGLGATIGMGAWVAFGQRFANEVVSVVTGSGITGRFAVVYLVFLGFTQALPLDLTLSPYKAYQKFRHGGVQIVPFGEFRLASNHRRWEQAAASMELAVLFLPVGLLAGCLPGGFWRPDQGARVALAGLAFAAAIELAQVLVESRNASATDVLVGGAAVLFGWLLAHVRAGRELPLGRVLGLGSCWLIAVGVTGWQPFTFAPPIRPFDWVPPSPLKGENAPLVLEEMAAKLVLFGLGGVLVVSMRVQRSTPVCLTIAFTVGLAFSGLSELGQRFLPNHTPCITDLVLGGVGALIGAWMASKVCELPPRSGGPFP